MEWVRGRGGATGRASQTCQPYLQCEACVQKLGLTHPGWGSVPAGWLVTGWPGWPGWVRPGCWPLYTVHCTHMGPPPARKKKNQHFCRVEAGTPGLALAEIAAPVAVGSFSQRRQINKQLPRAPRGLWPEPNNEHGDDSTLRPVLLFLPFRTPGPDSKRIRDGAFGRYLSVPGWTSLARSMPGMPGQVRRRRRLLFGSHSVIVGVRRPSRATAHIRTRM